MNTLAQQPHAARRPLAACMPDPAWWRDRPQSEALNGCASDLAFSALRAAFRASGGLVCNEDLERLLADYHLDETALPLAQGCNRAPCLQCLGGNACGCRCSSST